MTENVEGRAPSRPAARHWAQSLAGWAIPPHVLEQAPTSPWILPVELFTVSGPAPDSPAHGRARQALDDGGSVLDLGCGGGRAAFALVPPATSVIGLDSRQQMLDAFAAQAERRAAALPGGLHHQEILGDWPQVAPLTPSADVVVAHHVLYNVPDLAAFALAADAHAHRRVVFELPQRHPLSWLAPLWRHFWGVERPHGPTADDAAAVLREAGLDVHTERWLDEAAGTHVSFDRRVEMTRIRLCLNASRDEEVAEQLRLLPERRRELTALWWHVSR